MNRLPYISGLVLAVTLGCVSLTACATPREPQIRTVEVRVPVPVSCLPKNTRDAPAFPDTDEALKATPGPDAMILLLAAGRTLRDQWIREVSPVLEGCR